MLLVFIDEAVSDFSWAGLNALCRSFNNMNIKRYLDLCYEILSNNDEDKIHSITTLRLCSSHISKNISSDIAVFFKKEYRKYIAALIGVIFDLKSFAEVESFLRQFIIILLSKFQSDNFTKAQEKFCDFVESSEWILEESHVSTENTESFEEFETIYKHSKFFQKFDKIIQSFEDIDGTDKNPYYNPKFAAIFLKKYIAYLPFWSGLLTSLRYEGMKRASNAIIEGKNIFQIFVKRY